MSGTTRVPSWFFGRAATNAPPNDLSGPRKSGFATAMYVVCCPPGTNSNLIVLPRRRSSIETVRRESRGNLGVSFGKSPTAGNAGM